MMLHKNKKQKRSQRKLTHASLWKGIEYGPH